ncbi:MAG: hypothetical protein GY926_19355 [bacterium]|nr:hypothetical protein [bacterium]
MTTLRLDPITHDLTVAGGSFQDVSGAGEIQQNVKIRLLRFRGEVPRDANAGMPYHDEIMQKGVAPSRLDFLYRSEIEGTLGITELIEGPEIEVDATRRMTVEFRADTDVGLLSFNVETIT